MKIIFQIFSFFIITTISKITADDYTINTRLFPEGFIFAAATASYQVEGAWNEDGKGESIWDRATHTIPSPVIDNSTGDIACDSYHKYKEDVSLLKEIQATHYRFSLAWTRIIPNGLSDEVNEAGIKYYQDLIRELKEANIEPLITIFHWDTPQDLSDVGGWTNEIAMERFVYYAKVCFENFGSDVKYWITFNEPKQTCQGGYGNGQFAPFVKSPGIGEYLCTHNVVRAHARVWHMYDELYRATQNGFIGMSIDTEWKEPATQTEDDVMAAERVLQFTYGWFVNPVTHGDYPTVMKSYISERSVQEGFNHSRLPSFTEDEIEYMRGCVDFLGTNYYTTYLVSNDNSSKSEISWEADSETIEYFDPEWESTAAWMKVVPWGIGKLVTWISSTYGNIPILITENGYADDGSSLEDDRRAYYYQQHLSRLRDAMDQGVNIIGYTAWSLMDNFEWLQGYTQKFGIYRVDFDNINRTRTPKKSVAYIRNVFRTRCLVEEDVCWG